MMGLSRLWQGQWIMEIKENNITIFIYNIIRVTLDILMSPVLILSAVVSRFYPRKYDVGIGPVPLINSVYHKKALELYGVRAQTFVDSVYFITDDFDVRFDQIFKGPLWLLLHYFLFIRAVFCYRCLYIYFNGGPLRRTGFLRLLEPLLLKIAGVKIVVMPYGSDVQVMTRSDNLMFKQVMAMDYPKQGELGPKVSRDIDRWIKYADCIISGCEWVDYMPSWDKLCLSHFAIDMDYWQAIEKKEATPAKILHAPNHRNIKGTDFFVKAVEELQKEGEQIELIMLEKVPNDKIHEVMISVDIVADQLIIGWYAMFAIEAMSLGKPVLCHLRKDLEELYISNGLLEKGEIPIVNCTVDSVKETIRELVNDQAKRLRIGRQSIEYVQKHHSLQAIGEFFNEVNNFIGLDTGLE
jgi:glycosyltransferase involved in cell wall biosynthesis